AAGVERPHRADAAVPGEQPLPHALPAEAERRDGADAGDDDAPVHDYTACKPRCFSTSPTAWSSVRMPAYSSSETSGILKRHCTSTMVSRIDRESIPRWSRNEAWSPIVRGSILLTLAIASFTRARIS